MSTLTRIYAAVAAAAAVIFVLTAAAVDPAVEAQTPEQQYVAAIRAFEGLQEMYGIEVGHDTDAQIIDWGQTLCEQEQPDVADIALAAQYLCKDRLPEVQAMVDAAVEADQESVPPCESEDSDGPCYWNAATRGNGQGTSFVRQPDGGMTYRYIFLTPYRHVAEQFARNAPGRGKPKVCTVVPTGDVVPDFATFGGEDGYLYRSTDWAKIVRVEVIAEDEG